jgi:hypothetical protein
MEIELTMRDLLSLATHSKVEKDGVAVIIKRPVLTRVKTDRDVKKAEALFFQDTARLKESRIEPLEDSTPSHNGGFQTHVRIEPPTS